MKYPVFNLSVLVIMITKGSFYGYLEDEDQNREQVDAYLIIVAQDVKEWGYVRDLIAKRRAFLIVHPDEAKPGEVDFLTELLDGTL